MFLLSPLQHKVCHTSLTIGAGRVRIPTEPDADGEVSCYREALGEDISDVQLPPDSEDEARVGIIVEKSEGWVHILIVTDRKKFQKDRLITSGVPLCCIVTRSEASGNILRGLVAWCDPC